MPRGSCDRSCKASPSFRKIPTYTGGRFTGAMLYAKPERRFVRYRTDIEPKLMQPEVTKRSGEPDGN